MNCWHLNPLLIEETWTDEFFNLMVWNFIDRQEQEYELYSGDTSPKKAQAPVSYRPKPGVYPNLSSQKDN